MNERYTWLLALLLGSTACGGSAPRTTQPPSPPPAREVLTTLAAREAGPGDTVPAVVVARQRAVLAARIPASVVELPRRVGEAVAAGDVVARLDDAALGSAVQAAEAGLAAADSDLRRAQNLMARGAATPREAEEATTRAAAARAQLVAARDQLAYAVLRAPFAGRVAARPVNVGDVVSPGRPVVEIEGAGGLEVLATVEAGATAALSPGSRVEALVDGQAEPLSAVVRAVSPAGDAATHRFEVRADLPGVPGLRSGLFARLLLPSLTGPSRITVPEAALFARGGLTGVFVVQEGRARLRFVARGARVGGGVEVRAGLAAGESVVLDPQGLVDGAPVHPRPRS